MRRLGRRRLYRALGILAGLAALGVLAWWLLLPRPLRVIAKLAVFPGGTYALSAIPTEGGVLLRDHRGRFRLHAWSDGQMRWQVQHPRGIQGVRRDLFAVSPGGRYLVLVDQPASRVLMWRDGRLLGAVALPSVEVDLLALDSGDCWAWEKTGDAASRLYLLRQGRLVARGRFHGGLIADVVRFRPMPVGFRPLGTDGRLLSIVSSPGETTVYRVRVQGARIILLPLRRVPAEGMLVAGGRVLTATGDLFPPAGAPRRVGAGYLQEVREAGRLAIFYEPARTGRHPERYLLFRPATGARRQYAAHPHAIDVVFSADGRYVLEYREQHRWNIPPKVGRLLGPLGSWLDRQRVPCRLQISDHAGRPRAVLSAARADASILLQGHRYAVKPYHSHFAPHARRLVVYGESAAGVEVGVFLLGW